MKGWVGLIFVSQMLCPQWTRAESARTSSVVSSGVAGPSGSSSSLSLYGGLTAADFTDSQSQSLMSGVTLGFRFGQALSPSLHMMIDAGAQLDVGHSEAQYNDDFKPQQRLQLREAALRWELFTGVDLKFGTLPQGRDHSALLLSDVAFPGARQELTARFGGGGFVGLQADESVPTGAFYSPVVSASNGLPYFLSGRLHSGYEGRSVNFFASLGAYEFGQLSADLAQNGRFRGNTVEGLGSSAAAFVYDYRGAEARVQLGFRLGSRVTSRIEGSGIVNLAAPEGSNKGILGTWVLEIAATPNLVLSPQASLFYNESDAAPAVYNDAYLGHSNVRGVGGGFGLKLLKEELSFDGRFATAQTLVETPYQSDLMIFSVRMVKSYALF